MNARRFVTLYLMCALSLVFLLNHSPASLYPPGTWDHTAMATISTLEATHIVVGEVTDVSFVFEQDDSEPLSIVTVRIDKDIKAEIERIDNENTNPGGRVSDEEATSEEDSPPETVSFIQVGGPYEDGDWVSASGMPLLTMGDDVFLRLKPSNFTVRHNGKEYNSCTDAYGTVYPVQTEGDNVDEYIINKAWQGVDVDVMEMARIVRTTLKQPETMRTLERQVNTLEQENRFQTLMDAVAGIEATLDLPPFTPEDR